MIFKNVLAKPEKKALNKYRSLTEQKEMISDDLFPVCYKAYVMAFERDDSDGMLHAAFTDK